MGALVMIGDTASTTSPSPAIAASAAVRTFGGGPWRGWRWFEPSAIR